MTHLPLLLLLSFNSWAGIFGSRQPTSDEPTIIVNARALAVDDRMEAIGVLEEYLAEGNNPELVPWVTLEAGEQRRLAADPTTAQAHFQRIRNTWPDHPSAESARLGLALVDFDSGRASGNTAAVLTLVDDLDAPDTMNADRYRLLALQGVRDELPQSDLKRMAGKAVAFAGEDPQLRARVLRDLGYLVDVATEDAQESVVSGGDTQALLRAHGALKAGDYTQAADTAKTLLATFPDTELRLDAEWVIKRADARDPFNARTVGVLLPLTGKFAPPAKQIQAALEMAARDAGGGVRLVVKDTGGDPEEAAAAFEQLVLTDGVAAVVGPLLKDNVEAVAKQAQAARVPLVTLTQTPGVTDVGDWVYRGFLTTEQQVLALLDHSMDSMGLRSFGVMAPDTPYGHSAHDDFAREVAQRGGSIVSAVFYDPAATDFRKQAAELGAKDYENRKGELYRLRKDAEERGMNPDKVVLPPATNFDGIFIPDSYARVALVASALAYEEFAVGGFKPRRHDKAVPLLGLNGWHNKDLIPRGGKYVLDSYFVDAFDAGDPAVSSFVEGYRSAHSRTPGAIEALAYDTARMVAVACRTAPADREALRTALSGASLAQPVSGATGFSAERELQRSLHVFGIAESGFYRVDGLPTEPPIDPTPR